MKRIPWRPLLAAASGAGIFLGAPTFYLWAIAWIALVPLLIAIRHQSPRRAFMLGWLGGLVVNLGGFYWTPQLLMRFGHLPWLPSAGLFVLLAGYQGLPWAAFAWIVARLRRERPHLPLTLVAPVAMTAVELVTPMVFDWYLAITQAPVIPVIQVADLTGPLGVTFLIVLVNALVYDVAEALLERRRPALRQLLAGSAIVVAALVYGTVRLHQIDTIRRAAPKITVGVVQANLGITQKARPGRALRHHRLHLRQSWKLQQRGAELLVWPESAYPFAINRDATTDFPEDDPRQIMRGIRVPLILGALSYSDREPYPYNSAFMIAPDGRILGRYDKNFLLVFGEYIPFYEHFRWLRDLVPAMSNFARGHTVTTFPFHGTRIGPLICYEDILSSFGHRLAHLRPQLLVNITNDAWFGATAEPYQHMALSIFRSVELRLDLVRAVNTGVSATIDAAGRLRKETASHDPSLTPGVLPETLLDTVALMPPSHTVYDVIGDSFGYVCVALTALLLWLFRQRRKTTHRG